MSASHPEAATRSILQEKVFLEISQNSQENTCARVSFLIKLQALACNFIKKETPTQVFSCEFYEISKNTFFTKHLWATASEYAWHSLLTDNLKRKLTYNHIIRFVIFYLNIYYQTSATISKFDQ